MKLGAQVLNQKKKMSVWVGPICQYCSIVVYLDDLEQVGIILFKADHAITGM